VIYTLSLHDALPIFMSSQRSISMPTATPASSILSIQGSSLAVTTHHTSQTRPGPSSIGCLSRSVIRSSRQELHLCTLGAYGTSRSEEHTSELQSRGH